MYLVSFENELDTLKNHIHKYFFSLYFLSDTEKAVLGNGFTVDVTAESVQASNDAVEQTWKDAPSNVIAKLKSLQMQGKTEQNTTTK